VKGLLAELERAGITGKTRDGTYFSRRMVRDEYKRRVRAAGGGLSLGHPNVPPPKDAPKDVLQGRPSHDGEGGPSRIPIDSGKKDILQGRPHIPESIFQKPEGERPFISVAVSGSSGNPPSLPPAAAITARGRGRGRDHQAILGERAESATVPTWLK
jgi:hypothetical protein